MKIVIAGAGEVGYHLAKLLSYEYHETILIDTNQEALDSAFNKLDILPIKGDASSRSVLANSEVHKASLFMAVTTSEHTNLVSAILAKKMGAKKTIARVENPEFLDENQRNIFNELGIDTMISPNYLLAKEISRLLEQTALTDIFEFEEGKLSVIGLTVSEHSFMAKKNILEIDKLIPDIPFRPIAILRGNNTIRPRGSTIVRPKDHIYLMAKKEEIDKVSAFAGQMKKKVKNVMILGGEEVTRLTASMLEKDYNVTIVESDKNNCKMLLENLDHSLVIKGDPTNLEILKEEGLKEMDALISLLPNSESNIIASLMAEDCDSSIKSIALVDNADYIRLSQNMGVDTLINTKLVAANNIFRFVRKGEIEAIASLHGVDAEIIEFNVSRENKLTRKPLSKLNFPEKALIAGVIRNEEGYIPKGDFQLKLGDKVIVFSEPESIGKVEKMFR
ncbi:Trk system potassium transporter TrkA [Membranihabitans maritimus]|uniref:Trk system potassium transporter TrkA n=1 Tax=Membranihabitans maritimus TaxID=2904244 RepID=UPI001F0304D1|nr:Trk system potassium transporter TrkA [Membranihabitans maritimus]